jgi:acetyl-CoA synthetase
VNSPYVPAEVVDWIQLYGGDHVPVARLLCDNHARSRDGLALIVEGADGRSERLTYRALQDLSARFGGALRELGVGAGDRISVLLPKSPELVVALLGIWRIGAVHVPLFTAFGPEAVEYRVNHSGSLVLVTDAENVVKLTGEAGRLEHVVCVDAARATADSNLHDFWSLLERVQAVEPESMGGNDLLILLYTSGTTGHPKGVQVPVRGLAFIHAYMHYGLDVRPDDRFWNIADPGWGYGLWFGVMGSLLLGQTMLLRDVVFDAPDVLAAITRHRITNMASAPTVYRAIRAAGVPAGFKNESSLRAISSAGEPLNPELLEWSQRELGSPIHDHYGQSEAGMVLGHHHHPDVHHPPAPGSMGVPLPGFRAVVLDDDGREVGPGVDGELAIDTDQSPLFCFKAYYRDPDRTAERFRLGRRYYLTGDTARVGGDGLFRFASRADDVILSAGYRIGPFEIENVLITDTRVAEVAVIGTPDELRGQTVTAFIVPVSGIEPSEELVEELKQLVKTRLAAHMYPRNVRFIDSLPRTHSGKIQRNVLRRVWEREAAPV